MSLVCPAPAQHHSREPLTPFGYPVGFWTLTTRYGICVFPDGAATNPSPKASGSWLGRRDSNPRMAGPKPAALPLGYAPMKPLAERKIQ